MEKANLYTLYLSGVINENQYLDMVEKQENINEISYRTADAAAKKMFDKMVNAGAEKESDSAVPEEGFPKDMEDRYNKFRAYANKKSLNIPVNVYITQKAVTGKNYTQNYNIRINQIDIENSKKSFFRSSRPVGVLVAFTEMHSHLSYKLGKEMYIDLVNKKTTFGGQEKQVYFDRAGMMSLVSAINQQAGEKIVDASFFNLADDAMKNSSEDINDKYRKH